MTHQIINLEGQEGISRLVLQHKDFNLDKKDNLDSLPAQAAVYAVCGRVNGQPVNARFVGATDNLLAAVKAHYSDAEPNEQLKLFMRSIKIKELLFKPMPGVDAPAAKETLEAWEKTFQPECNEELNKVY
jgi:hypothetical protein